MHSQPFFPVLKDLSNVEIRNPEEKDVPSLIEYLHTMARETNYMLNTPEECSRYTEENEKAFINRVNESETDLMLVCIFSGRVIGACQITFNTRLKTRHRASVAIGLIKEFWGRGIGSALMTEMLSAAKQKAFVSQVELEFIQGNTRARALYEKFGFKITGTRPDAVRLTDGTMLDEIMMVRKLPPGRVSDFCNQSM